MFHIVSPANYVRHTDLIQEYKIKLLEVNDEEIPEEEQGQAFYVICQESDRGVVGGAYLVKKSMEALPVALRDSLHLLKMKEPIWQCAGLYFELPEGDPAFFMPSVFEEACLNFYRNIYETFMNFSVLQNTPLLLAKLNEDDYQDTLYFGLWPYLTQEREDDEVFGLLSLHAQHYVLFQTQWRI
jgi:hypothetical protein